MTVKRKEKGREEGVEMNPLTFSCPLRPSVHSNSKSDVSGWINDRELVTLTRPYCRLHPAGRNIACLISDLRPILQR